MINSANIKRLILLNLPYIFFFWMFNKIGEAVRIAPGNKMSNKLVYGIGHLKAVLENPFPSFNSNDLLVGLVGAVTVFCVVWYKKSNSKKWRKNIEYGSARWGNRKDIIPYVDPVFENNIILTATESLMLNGRPKDPKYARNKNVLIIGGSGSGKTRFWLKPNLMQMHSSYVITDPKGLLC